MKTHKWAIFAAIEFSLFVLTAASLFAQDSGVPLDFGSKPNDVVLAYGIQYQATPRHVASPSSGTLVLPGSVSYNLSSRWTFKVDATTLKSVEHTPKPRATGVGDMDADISFVAVSEGLKLPGVTIDYQLNIPTGDASKMLGTGEFGHRFATALVKVRNSWKYQVSIGDLFTRRKSGYDYSNSIFVSLASTYTFPKKDLANAVPTFKTEIDFLPPYSSAPQSPSVASSSLRTPTEIYEVSTLTIPLRWKTKFILIARAGITPYTPKFVVMMQFQHLFRPPLPSVGCP